jgi:hypothetical protein
MPLYRAAWKVDMDAKTARKYRETDRLPSESPTPRSWPTRQDPFEEVWPELEELLEREPGLQAKALFEDLQRPFPGRFPDGQLRTSQRKVKAWKAVAGQPKEVFFDQVHTPGQLGASDFTHMEELRITLAGQPFDHMVYHFVLTFSNWETGSICFSESFESLSQGLRNALWALGGVPQLHRTDRLTAAVNNLGDRDLFQQHYRALLAHYGLRAQAIKARKAHENGDAEQSHHRLKQTIDQALMLRGGRDFDDRAAKEPEAGVDAVLGGLLERGAPITPTVVADQLRRDLVLPRAMDVVVTKVDLSSYDLLLETGENFLLSDQRM